MKQAGGDEVSESSQGPAGLDGGTSLGWGNETLGCTHPKALLRTWVGEQPHCVWLSGPCRPLQGPQRSQVHSGKSG